VNHHRDEIVVLKNQRQRPAKMAQHEAEEWLDKDFPADDSSMGFRYEKDEVI
jgi:hypothetical protein